MKTMKLTFVEVPAFIKQIDKLGKPQSVEVLTALQDELLKDPKRGDVIKGTGGARKARIGNPSKGKGKSGGFRYIYSYFESFARIYLFYFYEKKTQDDLTDEQTKMLAEVIGRTKDSLKGSK
jgi:mRNA-degrading endonuclease RelE of RelBE toxin-antitoxin system